MSESDALIVEAAEQLAAVRGLYEDSLRAQEVPEKLQVKIKNVLENQRSALEYIANAVVERDGKVGSHAYYPLAKAVGDFAALFDKQMKGVAAVRPDIRNVVGKYQPFQSGYDWLGHLAYLTNENKHRRLTPQTRTETHRRSAAGGAVTWDPKGVTFGSGVSIGGQPVNPVTQRTSDTIDVVYVDWLFADLNLSALRTLERIQAGLPSVIKDVRHVAGL